MAVSVGGGVVNEKKACALASLFRNQETLFFLLGFGGGSGFAFLRGFGGGGFGGLC